MADWIPMQIDLSRRSEVVRIAEFTGLSRHQVVGMLLDFWGWASSESVDGNVDASVDGRVDALVDTLGLPKLFFDALMHVGWFVKCESKWVIPNWERWLSKSAKSRVSKNLRQKQWRANVDGRVDARVDGRAPTTGEESTVIPPVVPQGGRKLRKTRAERSEEAAIAAFKRDLENADRTKREMAARLK